MRHEVVAEVIGALRGLIRTMRSLADAAAADATPADAARRGVGRRRAAQAATTTAATSAATCRRRAQQRAAAQLQREWVAEGGDEKAPRLAARALALLLDTHLQLAEKPLARSRRWSPTCCRGCRSSPTRRGPTPRQADGWPSLDDRSFAHFFRACFAQLNASFGPLLAHIDSKRGTMRGAVPRRVRAAPRAQARAALPGARHARKHATLASALVQACVLREGRKFIERFLRTLPLMEQQFNFQQDAVLAILTPIQAGTRQLHAIMGHGKMGRDAKLAREMPKARKALELLTFRIKELAHENDCFGAIEVAAAQAPRARRHRDRVRGGGRGRRRGRGGRRRRRRATTRGRRRGGRRGRVRGEDRADRRGDRGRAGGSGARARARRARDAGRRALILTVAHESSLSLSGNLGSPAARAGARHRTRPRCTCCAVPERDHRQRERDARDQVAPRCAPARGRARGGRRAR